MSVTFAKDESLPAPDEWTEKFLRSILFVLRYVITLLVGFTVATTIAVFSHELALWQSILLTTLAALYLAWALLKSHLLVAAKFGIDQDRTDNGITSVAWKYFAVQLGLAASIIVATRGTQAVQLLWLILLPSAIHATILLPRWGILGIAGLCAAIDAIGMVGALGWQSLPRNLENFGLWFGFVVVVTAIAVRTVKSRQKTVLLAAELNLANLRLRKFAIQAEELAATRERYRLAREIHDTIGHALTVAHVQLEVALLMIDQDLVAAREAIRKSQTVVREGLQDIRESVSELRSSPIENRSLFEALQRIVMEFETVECPIDLDVIGEVRTLPEKSHMCLFRAGQECVTNSKRHSSATRIVIIIDYSEPDFVSLTVKDNGCGSTNLQDGFGLIGMRERTQDVGGTVMIATGERQGFEVRTRVPG